MLSLQALSKVYGSTTAPQVVLHNVTFEIGHGEFCALIGPSGSGKTTLMNLIGLLDRPTHGQISINGTPTQTLSSDATASLRSKVIGFVFQSFHLLPNYTILENVALPLVYRGVDKKVRNAAAAKLLQRVGLSQKASHRPGELSGGQCQRVAIARALIGNPSLLLADEPTGNLDSRTADEIMALFLELNAELGLTVIIVTHDPIIAVRCARQIVMRDGQIFHDNSYRFSGAEVT